MAYFKRAEFWHRTTTEISSIDATDGRLRGRAVRHLNESETTRATGVLCQNSALSK